MVRYVLPPVYATRKVSTVSRIARVRPIGGKVEPIQAAPSHSFSSDGHADKTDLQPSEPVVYRSGKCSIGTKRPTDRERLFFPRPIIVYWRTFLLYAVAYRFRCPKYTLSSLGSCIPTTVKRALNSIGYMTK